jgi:aryl-alcohol dehydrogenase-like predicted oxidoreductase
MEKRALGKTTAQLSVIGFGGIVVTDVEPDEASRIVAQAVDRGISYFDVAPSYGNAEERLGPALEPYRDQVFLACKTGHRLADEAKAQLHQSLEHLRTDHLDLYQFHGVSSLEDVDKITGPGGALETFVAARDQGLVRHIGFSAHLEEAALRLLDAFPFDSMLLPINTACWTKGGFGPRAVEKAQQQGTGVLALKALAKRPVREGEVKKWPKCWYVPVDTLPEACEALAFTLGQPVTAAVCPGHEELLWLACDALDALGDRSADSSENAIVEGEPIFTTETSS